MKDSLFVVSTNIKGYSDIETFLFDSFEKAKSKYLELLGLLSGDSVKIEMWQYNLDSLDKKHSVKSWYGNAYDLSPEDMIVIETPE